MRQHWRFSDLVKGLGWGVLVDLVTLGLVLLLTLNAVSMAWAGGLVWGMAALAVTGFSIAEERYLTAVGFWLVQLGLFALFLGGYIQLLAILSTHK
ncbi:MAG TPA: hypothetical protein VNT75_02290 [Symbiobacteriaceae bacterium]|nr:hypothetical protein [Symbiobacteriaceae bacterium]